MALSQCPRPDVRRRAASACVFPVCSAFVLLLGCSSSFGMSLKDKLAAEGKAELERMKERAAAEARAQGGELAASAVRAASSALMSAAEQELLATDGTPAAGASSQGPQGRGSSRDWSPESREAAAAAVQARETNELAALLLSRIAPLGVASAKLCELTVRRVNAQEEIRKERAAEKYSGVANQDVLHAAGRTMVEMDEAIERLRGDIDRKLRQTPTVCDGPLRTMASCMAASEPCNQEAEDIRRAFTHVDARFRGVFSDQPERELRAKMDTLRMRGAEYRAVSCEQMLRL